MPIQNLQTIPDRATFDTRIRNLIVQLEGRRALAYYDTALARPLPTIGIGFNLADQGVRDRVFEAMQIRDEQTRRAIETAITGAATITGTPEQRDAALQQRLATAYGQAFSMTNEAMNAAFSGKVEANLADGK